jgi:hypothetical protein
MSKGRRSLGSTGEIILFARWSCKDGFLPIYWSNSLAALGCRPFWAFSSKPEFMLSIFDLRVKHGVADWAPRGKLETGRNWKHVLSHYKHCREAILDVAPDEAPGS